MTRRQADPKQNQPSVQVPNLGALCHFLRLKKIRMRKTTGTPAQSASKADARPALHLGPSSGCHRGHIGVKSISSRSSGIVSTYGLPIRKISPPGSSRRGRSALLRVPAVVDRRGPEWVLTFICCSRRWRNWKNGMRSSETRKRLETRWTSITVDKTRFLTGNRGTTPAETFRQRVSMWRSHVYR